MLAWAMPTGAILGPLARMLDAYAPWLLALGLILAAVAVVLGARRTGSLLTLALALAGAVQVSAYLSATRPAQPALPGDLRVLFFNAFAENASNGARIVAAALETEADILIFAEAEALLGDLDTLTERYAFVSPCGAEACELLIATNLPVLRSWQLQLNPAWPARYAVTEVDLAGHGPLFIAAGHLVKPWMSGLAEPELAQLTAQLKAAEWSVGGGGRFQHAPMEPANARASGGERVHRAARRSGHMACRSAGAVPHPDRPGAGAGRRGRARRRAIWRRARVEPSGTARGDRAAVGDE
jgi:hypothetical protein